MENLGDIFTSRPFKHALESVYQNINDKFDEGVSVADEAITDAKLAVDIKVGSLATLTTEEKGSVVGALNEIDANANTAQSTANAKYTKPADGIPSTDMTAAVIASLGLADTALQAMNFETATPVNAVVATKTLTIDGVVIDGETVTIGDDVYEFCADVAQSLSTGTIAVDITAVSTKSQGKLTIDTQPTAGNTMTIGTKVYTFVPDGTANADGEVSIGTDLASSKVNIVAAINGTDSVNTAHTLVSAGEFVVNDCILTAFIGGVAGDLIATTETFTAETNVFDDNTLGTTTAGVDCVQADAVTALALAITTSDTQGVEAVDGEGDTVVLTADVKGIAGNSIVIGETMAHGVFAGGATALSGGIDGTVGTQWEVKVDATHLYVCIATNTITDTNWRKISLGSAY
jgi:hypothetical protein